jgi:ribosome-associated toxin RatA of RatAB toxin-antitoxin module
VLYPLASQVWRVLTDYEALPSFVPNLESCQRVACPTQGRVWVRQRGCSQAALWRLEASALLEIEELALPLGRREARFRMVEGDFREFEGRWVVEPDPASPGGLRSLLRYEAAVAPKMSLPATVVGYVVRAGLPANIRAVARRAEKVAEQRLQASGLASWVGVEEDVAIPPSPTLTLPPVSQQQQQQLKQPKQQQQQQQQPKDSGPRAMLAGVLPSKGPFWPSGSPFEAAAPITAEAQRRQARNSAARSAYLGVVSVPLPLPPSGSPENGVQKALDEGVVEKQQRQQAAPYPAFGLRGTDEESFSFSSSSSDEWDGGGAHGKQRRGTASSSSAAPTAKEVSSTSAVPPAEVHLRRLDQDDFLHRRAVAAVAIAAPASEVWAVLTDYNRLAEFVPNLAASQRIKLPPGAPPNVVRVRQVGYKRLAYMCLHAESVLDLVERPCAEIQFRQVAGDLERFQGKWMLQELTAEAAAPLLGPSASTSGNYSGPCTLLKYAVEIIIPRATRMLGVMEPVLERVVFEDVPSNLAAIKRRAEAARVGAEDAEAAARMKAGRPKLPGELILLLFHRAGEIFYVLLLLFGGLLLLKFPACSSPCRHGG